MSFDGRAGVVLEDGDNVITFVIPGSTQVTIPVSLFSTAGAQIDSFTVTLSDTLLPVSVSNTPTVTLSDTEVPTHVTPVAQTPASPTVASVTLVSDTKVAANANRTGLILINRGVAAISLGLGAAAVNGSGITLNPNGGTWVMDDHTFMTGLITAITSDTGNLAIQEFS